jgi:hypothetical protein
MLFVPISLFVTALTATIFAGRIVPQALPTNHAPALPAWLAGCWEARTTTDTLEEYWGVPRAHMMLGVSRLVHRDSLVTYEQNRIEIRDSRIILLSQVAAEPLREYSSVDVSPSIAVFDSPGAVRERIVYRRRADTLHVRFEHRGSGMERGVEDLMTRVNCQP